MEKGMSEEEEEWFSMRSNIKKTRKWEMNFDDFQKIYVNRKENQTTMSLEMSR